jgi:tRNA modification GTPase
MQATTYFSFDTICALATGMGGPVAIIRISGPTAISALQTLSGREAGSFPSGSLVRVRLRDSSGEQLDDGLAVVFRNPRSFTGEDVVELQLHGGSATLTGIFEELHRLDVRPALPGEFSFRAVRNGKISLDQAQAVSDLITAPNRSAAGLALEKMAGSQNRLIHEFGEQIRTLASLSELGIDFADQDVDEVSLPRLQERAKSLLDQLVALEQSFERGQRLQEGITTALVGLPNAGKSSFFNSLLGEDRSIVSEIAGTTRDVVREKLNLASGGRSVTLRLEDTAGVRDASDSIEKIGVERTRDAAGRAELVILVIDASRGVDDLELLEKHLAGLCGQARAVVGILTKIDILTAGSERETALGLLRERLDLIFGEVPWFSCSSRTGEGMADVVHELVKVCSQWVHRAPGEVLLTRAEQQLAARFAADHLRRAIDASESELFAGDLRLTLMALGPLIGETPTDDILGRIFSQFCIGK